MQTALQATPTEAPVLVTAPHSTFIDPLLIGMTRSTVVAKHSLASAPLVSSLARLVQVVFVNRGKEDSRKATRDAIDAYTTRVKVRLGVVLPPLALFPNRLLLCCPNKCCQS